MKRGARERKEGKAAKVECEKGKVGRVRWREVRRGSVKTRWRCGSEKFKKHGAASRVSRITDRRLP